MTLNDQPARKPWRVVRELARWLLALVILWFLGTRLARDWPAVQAAFDTLSWGWIWLAVLPGVAFTFFRVAAWRGILRELGVTAPFGLTARVWLNGEIIRYIPGNVWSVIGRVAQFGKLGTTKSVVFASMVIETLVLLMAATGVAALGLMMYGRFDFAGRAELLFVLAVVTFIVASRRPLNWLVRLVEKLLRRSDQVGRIRSSWSVYAWMFFAWVMFGLMQLCVVSALGSYTNGAAAMALVGIFSLSWLIGYLSFLTPSGLGVREAVLVWLLQPYVDQPTALLIAVLSRVLMIVLEVVIVAAINLMSRQRAHVQTV